MMDTDLQVRLAAFRWLAEQVDLHGDVLPREILRAGFTFEGERVPLISPQGIFKPRILEYPLTITTAPNSPYDDGLSQGGYLRYRYRGADPQHRDNVGLRAAMERNLPLAYFHGVVPGKYLAVWPVYVIDDDPQELTFHVAVDEMNSVSLEAQEVPSLAEPDAVRRAYLTSTVRVRLHQRSFREKVLDAYRSQCAFCRLRHRELLDAAHIIPDPMDEGEPVVTNGLALCKLHHAAFDNFMIGVNPDYVIKVREDILDEEDGPILEHGLQELEGQRILLPANEIQWPDQDALAWKFERFQQAI